METSAISNLKWAGDDGGVKVGCATGFFAGTPHQEMMTLYTPTFTELVAPSSPWYTAEILLERLGSFSLLFNESKIIIACEIC